MPKKKLVRLEVVVVPTLAPTLTIDPTPTLTLTPTPTPPHPHHLTTRLVRTYTEQKEAGVCRVTSIRHLVKVSHSR